MADVIVVGAGSAGLMAALELRRARYSVQVLEAAGRVGGRIKTIPQGSAGVPIELGAEFVHGEARQTTRLLDRFQLVTVPVLGEHLRSDHGELSLQPHIWKRVGRVFRRLDPNREPDRSLQEFLDEEPGGSRLADARTLAKGFIEGFNAADAWRISERAIARQGDPTAAATTAARVVSGYGSLIDHLHRELHDVVELNSAVRRIVWGDGQVRVVSASGAEYQGRAAVITVPLPCLQDADIAFEPDIPAVRKAARQLVMGHAVRVTVVARQTFWQRLSNELSFVHTPDRPFNVWWTLYPLRAPVLVGWSGGPRAVALARGNVEAAALSELARAFGLRRSRLEAQIDAIHTHDWSRDRHIRGAYSYVGVGGSAAPRRLSRPVRGTLFFAGEATVLDNSGTVEGALVSGQRAFRQVVRSLR